MDVNIDSTRLGHILRVVLSKGESFYSQTGALISGKGNFVVKSELSGGLMSSALRAFGGGESLFINNITAYSDSELEFGTQIPSEILEYDLNGKLLIGDGAYLAHSGNIKISAAFGGLSSMIAGSGLFYLSAEGNGKLYLAGGESIIKKELKEGETFLLDNSSFLAVDSNVKFEKVIIGKGLVSKLFSGEAFMLKFRGPATVYYQTESPSGLVKYVLSHIGN